MKKLLEVKGISKRFGGLQAVSELSFDLKQEKFLACWVQMVPEKPQRLI